METSCALKMRILFPCSILFFPFQPGKLCTSWDPEISVDLLWEGGVLIDSKKTHSGMLLSNSKILHLTLAEHQRWWNRKSANSLELQNHLLCSRVFRVLLATVLLKINPVTLMARRTDGKSKQCVSDKCVSLSFAHAQSLSLSLLPCSPFSLLSLLSSPASPWTYFMLHLITFAGSTGYPSGSSSCLQCSHKADMGR